jgi:hypothetical protein
MLASKRNARRSRRFEKCFPTNGGSPPTSGGMMGNGEHDAPESRRRAAAPLRRSLVRPSTYEASASTSLGTSRSATPESATRSAPFKGTAKTPALFIDAAFSNGLS